MGNAMNSLVFEPPEAHLEPSVMNVSDTVPSSHGQHTIPIITCKHRLARIVLVYSHGNAEDLRTTYQWCRTLSNRLYVNVVAYDYCGYGMHRLDRDHTQPTQSNVFSDVNDVVNHAQRTFPQCAVVVYGRSLGSAPSIHAAASNPHVQGLILESAFLTCVKTMVNTGRMRLPFDMFPNEDTIVQCNQPTLIIHGMEDRVVPFWHGQQLFQLVPHPWGRGVWISKGSHNNLDSDHAAEVLHSVRYYLNDLQQVLAERALRDSLAPSNIQVQFSNSHPFQSKETMRSV